MRRFKVEPHYSSSLFQRLLDPLRFRRGTYHIPILGADEEKVSYLDTPVPEDAGLPDPLKPLKLVHQKKLESRLLQLPPELLIYAMRFLPHSSLYMVRQTCRVLRNLGDDFQFDDFHWEVLHHEDPRCYITMPLCEELWSIKRTFLRRSLCKPCGTLFDSGELEERLHKLWQRVDCRGCETPHPEFLFPQGDRENNICVGLLGEFAICKHIKLTGKFGNGEDWDCHCLNPEHFPADNIDYKERSAFNRYRPYVMTYPSLGDSVVTYSRSFPLVKIAPQQYPGMPALKSRLLKQLKEIHHDGLCQHASTQLESIVSSLPSDKCDCFPASGSPVYQSLLAGRDLYRCENHDYDCRHCGALYYWFYEHDYVVLKVRIDLARNTADGINWLANITFPTDQYPFHPILNESTKGFLWCSDPSCGTGCGSRWLLMVEILKRLPRDMVFGLPRRDRSFAANLPYTIEYQVFQNAAAWMARPNMLSIDLNFPF